MVSIASAQVRDGLNTLFSQLETALDTLIFASQLPLIGDNLQGTINLFSDAIAQLTTQLTAIENNPSIAELQIALFEALGPNGANVLRDLDGDGNTTVADIETIGDLDSDEIVVNFILGSQLDEIANIPLKTDIGLPGLNFAIDGNAQTALDLNFAVGFGFDQEGFFVDTANENELSLNLITTIPGLNAQTSTLGVLEFLASDDVENPTQFTGAFAIDLVNNDRLRTTQLNAIAPLDLVSASLNGSADINLNLGANFATSILPSISTDLNINWAFDSVALTAGEALVGELPSVSFNNASLNLGSFFSDFINPIFGTVQQVTGRFPLKQFADVVQKRVPILDVTILDLVSLLADAPELGYLGAIALFTDLVNSVPTNTGEISINLGSFQLGGENGGVFDVRDSSLSIRNALPLLTDGVDGFQGVVNQLDQLLNDPNSGQSPEAIASARNFFNNSALENLGGLDFPLFTNPTEAFKLLLNQQADLFVFDIPKLGFNFPIEFLIRIIGPLAAIIRGDVGAGIDLTVGFDTSGLLSFSETGNPSDILRGFYLTGDPAQNFAIANLTSGISAFAALDFALLSAGIGGGIRGDLNVVVDDPLGKAYFAELSACLFALEGALSAELRAFIEIGFSPFSFRKEKTLAKTTLLSFRFDADCNILTNIEEVDFGLATDMGEGVLRLNMGPNAGSRQNGVSQNDESENFAVQLAQAEDGTFTNTVEVSSFGIIHQYENITRIVADGGEEDDSIVIADHVLLPAHLQGGNGNDLLYGGGGDDLLEGGDGNDYLDGGSGNNTLHGGSGDDVLISGAGANLLDGGEGNDRVTYNESPAAVKFVPDPNNPGQFLGSGGNAEGDRLISVEYIEGSQFDDVLSGDDESNILEGLDGDDQLFGGGGDDFLVGGAGADLLDGGSGRNATTYVTSPIAVYINLEEETFYGGDADGDRLINIQDIQGSIYNDILIGDDRANRLNGFRGDDTLEGMAGADELDGGGGNNWAVYDQSPSQVIVSLADGKGSGGHAEGDLLVNIQNLRGSAYNDQLIGDRTDNILVGSAGNDTLRGKEGNDTLIGGEGADLLDGGEGIDLVDYSSAPSGVVVDLLGIGAKGHAQGDQYINVEDVLGSDFADQIFGTDGDNRINPGLSGGLADFVDGRGGRDRLVIDRSQDNFARLVGGFAPGKGASDLNFFSRQPENSNTILEQVVFTNIEDLEVIGTFRDDEIYGGEGDDIILGGAGNDTIYGGRGSNIIIAGEGDDFVVEQNDPNRELSGDTLGNPLIILNGGDGIDTLSIDLSSQVLLSGEPLDVILESTNPQQESTGYQFISRDGRVVIAHFEVFKDIRTGLGNDKITQLGRVDNIIDTTFGDDTITPGLGFDRVDGGRGDDVLILDYSGENDLGGSVRFDLNSFTHYTRFDTDETTAIDEIEFRNIERFYVTGTKHNDLLSGISATYLQFSNDTLIGGEGDDTILGFEGDDQLFGDDGKDLLFGGLGNDYLNGGDGDDILIDDLSVLIGDYKYVGGGNDTFEGGDGNDLLLGGKGDDRLFGENGNDFLIGGDGNDQLFGGDGDDILIGINFGAVPFPAGDEIDTMTGGAGADQFWLGDGLFVYYNDGKPLSPGKNNYALITDFNADEGDIIQLHGVANQYSISVVDGSTHISLRNLLLIGQSELIGIVAGVTDLDLNSSYFRYVDDTNNGNNNGFNGGISDLVNSIATLSPEPTEQIAIATRLNTLPSITKPLPTRKQPTQTTLSNTISTRQPTLQPSEPPLPANFASTTSFNATQNANPSTLIQTLLGDSTGLTITNVKLTGDARAFGTFQNDPFGLGSGIVLSTGKVEDLVGENLEDGGLFKPRTIDLNFEQLQPSPATASNTAIFRAQIPNLGFDIRSLMIADNGDGQGGAGGPLTGFDLDAIILSHELITNPDDIHNISRLNIFDFTPFGTFLTPGTQRHGNNQNAIGPNLFGTFNGLLDNSVATLDTVDYSGTNAQNSSGAVSLGDGGQIAFNFTEAVTLDQPLYLYLGEAGNNEAAPEGRITVSDRPVNSPGQLSTDFGFVGAEGDSISLEIEFDADDVPRDLFFQFVFGSEEFVEFGGSEFNDRFTLELNGINLARLSDGFEASINNLVPLSIGGYHPDFIHNPVGIGPSHDQTPLDGYTQVLNFAGPIQPNAKNTLTINIRDVQDGVLDSAVFLRAGSLGTSDSPIGRVIASPVNSDRLLVSEDGDTDRLSVVLNSIPTAPVTVTIQSDDQLSLGTRGNQPIALQFTPENAFIPQIVTVAAIDDKLIEGTHTGVLSIQTQSSDPSFDNPLNQFTVTAQIRDNDFNLIVGTNGADTLRGKEKNDRIIGLGSRDLLYGGGGADEFVYTSIRDFGDTIMDFEVGIDRIVLTDVFNEQGISVANYTEAVTQGYLGFGVSFTGITTLEFRPDPLNTPVPQTIFLPGVSTSELNNFTNFVI